MRSPAAKFAQTAKVPLFENQSAGQSGDADELARLQAALQRRVDALMQLLEEHLSQQPGAANSP